jgi:PPM family protein phosphatase
MSHDTEDDYFTPLPRSMDAARRAPQPNLPRIDYAAISDPGLVRENNEDSYLVGRTERIYETLGTNLPQGEIPEYFADMVYGFVVADGMGGHAAGEVASRHALRAIINQMLHEPDWIMRVDSEQARRLEERYVRRYAEIDRVLAEEAAADPQLAGMGTTMTIGILGTKHLVVVHVGDSRAYLLRGERLHRLTRDHSFAQALADAGDISQDEVATHKMRNVLLRYLGGKGTSANAEVSLVRLREQDQLLLCSDGLSDMVNDAEIAALLQEGRSAEAACQALVDAALAAGGRDNITVILARLLAASV